MLHIHDNNTYSYTYTSYTYMRHGRVDMRTQRSPARAHPADPCPRTRSACSSLSLSLTLQGIKEIQAVQDALLCTREYMSEPARSWVLPIHSAVPPEEQRMAFVR